MQISHTEQGNSRTRSGRNTFAHKTTKNGALHSVAFATAATPAIFAHDMRGPLANLTILLEGIAGAASRGQVDSIGRNVGRAMQTVERLGDMLTAMLRRFRELGDPMAPAACEIDLCDVVEKVASLNRPLAELRQVRMLCTLANPLPLRGDAHLLMQAIDNLMSNAITHTRPGGRVVCDVGPAESGGAMVRVSDEGPGLTAADIARLFRPFGKTPARKEVERTSHGLGLWIVALVAERHGGRVEAKSDGPGMGATFTLHLPPHQTDAL